MRATTARAISAAKRRVIQPQRAPHNPRLSSIHINQQTDATQTQKPSFVRHFAAAYDPRQTTIEAIDLFEQGPTPGAKRYIDSFDANSVGVNGCTYPGPVIVLPHTVLLWENVKSLRDVTEESLSVLRLVDPQIRLILIGAPEAEVYGHASEEFRPGHWRLAEALASNPAWGRVGIELLSTRHACHSFNFLNQEDRDVAACLIPGASLPDNRPRRRRRLPSGGWVYPDERT